MRGDGENSERSATADRAGQIRRPRGRADSISDFDAVYSGSCTFFSPVFGYSTDISPALPTASIHLPRCSVASPLGTRHSRKHSIMPSPVLARCARISRLRRIPECRFYSQSSRSSAVSVLFQDIEPPVINGVRKPKKPGGKRPIRTIITLNRTNRC